MNKRFISVLLSMFAFVAAYQATNNIWGIVAIGAIGLAVLIAAADLIDYEKGK